MSALFLDLADAADAPAALIGGKARQLGLLHRLKLPVPDGFVITAPALDAAILRGTGAASVRLAADALEAVWAELERRGWTERPLAIRSSAPHEDSATASFAGIHRSELNVVGPEALDEAIASVWSSLWTPQAAAYRARIGMDETTAAMAVIVMPMVPARAAGIAFTCDPLTGRDDRIIINAIAGLGDALVSGRRNGEEIIVAEDPVTEDLSVLTRRTAATGEQPVLDDTLALSLAALVREAAQALDYADPCLDLEWAWTGDSLILLQARPVTARVWNAYAGLAGQPSIWSNGNTRDVMPHVMGAMDWLSWRRMVDIMLERGYRLAGYKLLAGARRSALINGRLYLNVSLMQWEGFDAFGMAPKAMNAMLGGHHPEITVPPSGWRDRARRAGMMLRYVLGSGRERRRGRREADAAFAETARLRAEDLTAASDQQLAERLRSLILAVRTRHGMMFLQSSAGGMIHMLLERIERRFPGESHGLLAALLAGGEPSVSARQAYDLQAMAREALRHPATAEWLRRGRPWDLSALPQDAPFRSSFAGFIERYGHRGIYESYIGNPRFRDDPGYLLDTIAGLLDTDPDELTSRRQRSGQRAWERLRAGLPALGRLNLDAMVRAAVKASNERELARSAFIAYSEIIRRILLESADRLVARGALEQSDDVFHLTPLEVLASLEQGTDAGLRSRVAHRRRRMADWETMAAPEVVIGGHAPASLRASAVRSPGGTWRGIAVGGGIASGSARIIAAPEHGVRLGNGEILVAPSTDPAWTPLFLKAAGLVMETGGYLSHGAIVAREFGIPAVVNLPGILDALRDGQALRVDGTRGEVAELG